MSNETNVAKQPTRSEALKIYLSSDSVKEQFINALGEEMVPAYMASIIDLYNSDTNFSECKPGQVIQEVLKAAILRLPIIKQLGFAWVVAYAGKATFQIGYKGYIQLAYRTRWYTNINADMVYEGELTKTNKLTGEFDFTGQRKSDNVTGYFAYFKSVYGIEKTLHMTKEQVVAHAKKYSPSYKNPKSAWYTDFDKMGIKTVIRLLLSHWGFLSPEMIQADQAEDGQDIAEKVQTTVNVHQGTKSMNLEQVEEIKEQNSGGDMPEWMNG